MNKFLGTIADIKTMKVNDDYSITITDNNNIKYFDFDFDVPLLFDTRLQAENYVKEIMEAVKAYYSIKNKLKVDVDNQNTLEYKDIQGGLNK